MNDPHPVQRTAESAWKRRAEAGHRHGPAIVAWVARRFGRAAVGLLLHPVAAYFLLVRGPERRASRQFLSRVFDCPASWRDSYTHFYTFARVATDRLYMLAGAAEKLQVQIHGEALLRSIARAGRGCIVLSAHLGSFEAVRVAAANEPTVRLHIVLDRALNPNFTRRLDAVDPQLAARVIDASLPPNAVAIEIGRALQDGGWIGLPADRHRAGDRIVDCDFFGERAPFPFGPFAVATAFDVPVITAMGLYLDGRYELHFEPLPIERTAQRRARDAAACRAACDFAARLERYARMAPANWFNFYDFWRA